MQIVSYTTSIISAKCYVPTAFCDKPKEVSLRLRQGSVLPVRNGQATGFDDGSVILRPVMFAVSLSATEGSPVRAADASSDCPEGGPTFSTVVSAIELNSLCSSVVVG